ncbi:MAG: SDR family NAD(P)-dependent oxidoreductase [Actinomycetia bacterium]|nr:SDR family NAD(P)-dependent oxidoreductase [Actinomycetes bacterium]
MRLAGKTAVVTGGARGIGAATAVLLAREGASVLVADVNGAGADRVADTILKDGGTAEAFRVDVTDPAGVDEMMDRAIERLGGLEIVFNNAGIEGEMTPIEQTPIEEWHRVIDVNLTGTFLGCRAAVPRMRERRGGSIINVGSMMSFLALANAAAYCAAKSAVVMLTKATAIETAKDGIRVNVVCPGAVATPMQQHVLEGLRGHAFETEEELQTARTELAAGHPMRRVAEPEEIADAVLFLASDESSYLTGSELRVDGGLTAICAAVDHWADARESSK